MNVTQAARLLSQCRLVITHFRDVGRSTIRSFLRWYNRKNHIVARAIINTALSSVRVYHNNKIYRFGNPDEVTHLCSLVEASRQTTTDLHKSSCAHTKAFIKRLTGDDSEFGRVLAFAVRRSEGKQVVMTHFKQAA